MALSEQEKNLLLDLERSLAGEDAKRSPRFRDRLPAPLVRHRASLGVLAMVVGLVLALVGVDLDSIVGTVVAVLGSVLVILGVNGALDAAAAGVERRRAHG
jgi:hypothetical protein